MSNTTKTENIVGPSSKWEPANKTITIKSSTWKRLQNQFTHYGSTFDSVITDLLDEKERIIDSDMQEQKGNIGEFKI